MKCPACGEELAKKKHHDVVVDKCPACSGIWFDHEELVEFIEHFIDDHTDLPNATIELNRSVGSVKHLGESTRPCPRCSVPMAKLNYAYDSNVLVDRCHTCNGAWVDGNEIKPLAIYTKGNPKLDKLGSSMVEHQRKQQDLVDLADGAREFSRSAWALIFLPKIILPVGDDAPRRTVPLFTYGIILANLIVFLWMLISKQNFAAVFAQFGFISQRVMAGEGLYTVVTSMFLHASAWHVAGNMLFLWIFGDNVEDRFGHIGFVGFYVICELVSSLTFLALHMESTIPAVGASGAVAGVMGAYFVFYPHAHIRTFIITRIYSIPAALYLGTWFAMPLLYTFLSATHETGWHIAFAAHAGGFVAGIVLALLFKMTRARKESG